MPPLRVAHVATVDSTVRFMLLPQLVRLRDEGYEVTAISRPGPWVEEVERAGIRHVAWPSATRAWSPRADVRAFRELVGILRRERFDLVHTHNPKPGVLGRLAARLAGVPRVVNTVHGLYAAPDSPLARRLAVLAVEAVAARLGDLELYQSAEDLAWCRRRRVVLPRRAVLLGNGVDLERFRPDAVPAGRVTTLRRELGIPEGDRVVGTVGRLVAEKGYRELAAAARALRGAGRRVTFLGVGPADPEKPDALGRVGEDLVLTGWRDDVRDLLAVMDVFVLASWREGLPRSAIEAAAMGRPLVLTRIRGCREVARDGVEGLLVPPRDAGALARAIGALLDDDGLRERMGAAARARAVERFDERRVTDTIVRCYARLLDGAAPTGGDRAASAPRAPARRIASS
jgi:glycosyltransferase involved in cell wall biosynthesis